MGMSAPNPYTVGTPVVATALFRDKDGHPLSPSAIVIKVGMPDDPATEFTINWPGGGSPVTELAAGSFEAEIATIGLTPGLWAHQWDGEGALVADGARYFVLVKPTLP